MKAPYSLSCLLLFSLGACVPPDDRKETGEPGDGLRFETSWQRTADGASPSDLWREELRQRRFEDLSSLFSVAKELQGFGKERAGFRFRFGRQESREEEGEGVGFLRGDSEKRSGTLGNLAEELNGYNRKKGGFSFRFGRR
ncbi:orexigenic neuropeptide QRFP [Terrapene carolina triunguis]|uniref:Pyroglutamylated RFamide peptide n=1 Tax=Terrapene triunguis TaxID=2587831 RepID=A0A674JW68_9SAUR|nr:orexigenic neuropeptide QRFP [Terrapene carolina triunguis]